MLQGEIFANMSTAMKNYVRDTVYRAASYQDLGDASQYIGSVLDAKYGTSWQTYAFSEQCSNVGLSSTTKHYSR
jgi:hypothetical protein